MNFTYNRLKKVLDKNLQKMRGLLIERIEMDPVFFPHLFSNREDIEIAGFLSAQFAYGSIVQIRRFLLTLFSRMGRSPYEFVKSEDFSALYGLSYRFQKDSEIIELFSTLKKALDRYRTLGDLFFTVFREDIRDAIFSIRDELEIPRGKLLFFFPSPSSSNPLKRWNLFLRWMVRKDEVDFGIWEFIKPNALLVPLDTHIFKIARCLGFTKRRTKDAKTVAEITESFRILCPEDPLRYDFFLCHFVGIDKGCKGERSEICERGCFIYG